MTKELTAQDRNGNAITFHVGDTVVRADGSLDVVRSCFMAFHLVAPYAENYETPAVVLTNVSWDECSNLTLAVRG